MRKILILLFTLAILWLSLSNTQLIEVNLFFWDAKIPLSFIMLISTLVGVLSILIIGVIEQKNKKKYKKLAILNEKYRDIM